MDLGATLTFHWAFLVGDFFVFLQLISHNNLEFLGNCIKIRRRSATVCEILQKAKKRNRQIKFHVFWKNKKKKHENSEDEKKMREIKLWKLRKKKNPVRKVLTNCVWKSKLLLSAGPFRALCPFRFDAPPAPPWLLPGRGLRLSANVLMGRACTRHLNCS